MRERDDEDLALEHLEPSSPRHTTETDRKGRRMEPDLRATSGRGAHEDVDPSISRHRPRLHSLEEELHDTHAQLANPAIRDARTIKQLADTIAAIEEAHQRDRKPTGWRDRTAHRTRKSEREQRLVQLRDQRASLLDRVPEPDRVLDQAQRLHDLQREIAQHCHIIRQEAINEELAAKPPWLEQTLGPERTGEEANELWHKTARELAGHRIDNHITDPHVTLDQRAHPHDLERAIAETRAALGLEPSAYQTDLQIER